MTQLDEALRLLEAIAEGFDSQPDKLITAHQAATIVRGAAVGLVVSDEP